MGYCLDVHLFDSAPMAIGAVKLLVSPFYSWKIDTCQGWPLFWGQGTFQSSVSKWKISSYQRISCLDVGWFDEVILFGSSGWDTWWVLLAFHFSCQANTYSNGSLEQLQGLGASHGSSLVILWVCFVMNAVSGQRLEIHLVGLGLLQQQNRRATLRSSQRLRSGFSKKKSLESLENIQTCCCWCGGKLKCCVFSASMMYSWHLCSCKNRFQLRGTDSSYWYRDGWNAAILWIFEGRVPDQELHRHCQLRRTRCGWLEFQYVQHQLTLHETPWYPIFDYQKTIQFGVGRNIDGLRGQSDKGQKKTMHLLA